MADVKVTLTVRESGGCMRGCESTVTLKEEDIERGNWWEILREMGLPSRLQARWDAREPVRAYVSRQGMFAWRGDMGEFQRVEFVEEDNQ